MSTSRAQDRIRELNDAFRSSFEGGRVVTTIGVDTLLSDVKAMAIRKVATFDEFTKDNDPYHEHDFGNFALAGRMFFWKIDHYDQSLRGGSPDPADPKQTCRVMTIMLAEEY